MPDSKIPRTYLFAFILLIIVAVGSVVSMDTLVKQLDIEYPTLTVEEELSDKIKKTYKHPQLRYSNNFIHITLQEGLKRTIEVNGNSITYKKITLPDVCVPSALIEKKAYSDTISITFDNKVYKFILFK